jgi:hypothetical protein
MLTFLFWNINMQSLANSIVSLVEEYKVDVLILAESNIPDMDLISSLNSIDGPLFSLAPPGLPSRLKIYSRLESRYVKPIRDSGWITIRHLVPPIGRNVLLVAAHLPSKLYQSEQDQILNCTRFSRIIEEAETVVGHTRTLIIGDFNMNPFEHGIVGADGIHAVSDRSIAARGTRKVNGEDRRFFYNPMWNYFGDISPGPPGTYFYDTGTQVNLYWNIFDQVLIRPELLDSFSNDNVKVVTQVGSTCRISEFERPNKSVGSDHFPIMLRLNI